MVIDFVSGFCGKLFDFGPSRGLLVHLIRTSPDPKHLIFDLKYADNVSCVMKRSSSF